MFNTSTRKDDVSLKLRSQNLHNVKQQTKALEVESRRMEDRLQELKIAMTREKEERKAQGGGFWQKGQTGNLTNYAQDVLKKPKKGGSASSNREKSSKKTRVKVLKDEPINLPERNKAPGTMANIAQRNLLSSKVKIKGPKCGQCEQKGANVSCQECSEDYCAGCFAAFHLRGALKKHRSVPIGSAGLRPNMTALLALSNVATNNKSAQPSMPNIDDDNYRNKDYEIHDQPDIAGTTEANKLLEGNYDEQANAAEFAAALASWRTGRGDPENQVTPEVPFKPKILAPRPGTIAKVSRTDSGTSMGELERPTLEIKFKSSLSYADRLLLKMHRRSQLGMFQTATPPGEDQQQQLTAPPSGDLCNGTDWLSGEEFEGRVTLDDVIEMITPRGASRDVDPFQLSAHMLPGRQEAVYHTTQSHLAEQVENKHWKGDENEADRNESAMSIIVMATDTPSHMLNGYEESSNYSVIEVPDDLSTQRSHSGIPPEVEQTRYAFATPPTSGRPSPSGRRSVSVRRSYTASPISSAPKVTMDDLNTGMTTISQEVLLQRNSGKERVRTPRRTQTPVKAIKAIKKERPESSAKSNVDSRPGSAQPGSARPGSRKRSRTSMYGEGLLTKQPSEQLKDVARLAKQQEACDYQKADLSSFFTVGVKPVPVVDRVLTPRAQRKKPEPDTGITKWRVSHKLYSMSTRSWRPNNSLGDKVEEQQVLDHLQDREVVALEALSNDIIARQLASDDMVPDTPPQFASEKTTLSWSYSENVLGDAKAGRPQQESNKSNKSKARHAKTAVSISELNPATPEPSAMSGRHPAGSLAAESARQLARERSLHIKEKRSQALQQSEDLVPVEIMPLSSRLPMNPFAVSAARTGTPGKRPNSRGVVRPDSGRPGSQTPMRGSHLAPSTPPPLSGRDSRAIVVDGDDLSRFDELHEEDLAEDEDAIEQLEWELASQEGRLTADGSISQMLVLDPDTDIDIPEDSSSGCDLDSPAPPSEELLERQIRESVLMDDFAEMEDQYMADEVAALL